LVQKHNYLKDACLGSTTAKRKLFFFVSVPI
jgi:hypothetical protein